jgi:hypothetical protein
MYWERYYKYDTYGNKIEKAHYDSDGSLYWKYTYKYGSTGNMIEALRYEGDATMPVSQTVFEITYRK